MTPKSESLSIWFPNIIFLDLIPTLSHTDLVTSALSPVNTITRIPAEFIFKIDSFADSLGGSKNPIKPSKTIFFSSFTSKSEMFVISFFWQTATTLKPSWFNCFVIFVIFSLISLVRGETVPL